MDKFAQDIKTLLEGCGIEFDYDPAIEDEIQCKNGLATLLNEIDDADSSIIAETARYYLEMLQRDYEIPDFFHPYTEAILRALINHPHPHWQLIQGYLLLLDLPENRLSEIYHTLFSAAVRQDALIDWCDFIIDWLSSDEEIDTFFNALPEIYKTFQVNFQLYLQTKHSADIGSKHQTTLFRIAKRRTGFKLTPDIYALLLRHLISHGDTEILGPETADLSLMISDYFREIQSPLFSFLATVLYPGNIPLSESSRAFSGLLQQYLSLLLSWEDEMHPDSHQRNLHIKTLFNYLVTLRSIAGANLQFSALSNDFLIPVAALDLLLFEFDQSYKHTDLIGLLAEKFQNTCPNFATAIRRLIKPKNAATPAKQLSPIELAEMQKKLQKLQEKITITMGIQHTRGLVLASRIQMDNSKILRPLVDSIFSSDKLTNDILKSVKRLNADDLVDRNPVQLATPPGRRIEASVRRDLIRKYEQLIHLLKEAIKIRSKLERVSADWHDVLHSYEENGEFERLASEYSNDFRWLFTMIFQPVFDGKQPHLRNIDEMQIDTMLAWQEIKPELFRFDIFRMQEPLLISALPYSIIQYCEEKYTLNQLISDALAHLGGELVRIEQAEFAAQNGYVAMAKQLVADIEAEYSLDQISSLETFANSVNNLISKWEHDYQQKYEEIKSWQTEHRDQQYVQPRVLDLFEKNGYLAYAVKYLNEILENIDKEKQRQREAIKMQQLEAREEIVKLEYEIILSSDDEKRQYIARVINKLQSLLYSEEFSPSKIKYIVKMSLLFLEGDNSKVAIIDEFIKPVIEVQETPLSLRIPPSPARKSDDKIEPLQIEKAERFFRTAERHRVQGNIPAAEKNYREAIRWHPGYEKSYKNLATILSQSRRLDEAIRVLEKGLEHSPSDIAIYNLLAHNCWRAGQSSKARSYAHRGLSLCQSPIEEIGFYNTLVELERKENNFDIAITYCQKLIELQPTNSTWPKYLMQTEALKSGHTEKLQENLGEFITGELLPWEVIEQSFEISPFLEDDLSQEYSKVNPDFIKISSPESVAEKAFFLFSNAVGNPDTKRPRDTAEEFLIAAKLIVDLRQNYQNFNYIDFAKTKFKDRWVQFVGNSHEATLRKYLSYYSAILGDYHKVYGRQDSACAYYLEHFRLSPDFRPYMLIRAEKYLQIFVPSLESLREHARDSLKKYRVRERGRYLVEALIFMFSEALDITAKTQMKALPDLFNGILDLCLVNEASRQGLLSYSTREDHPFSRSLGKVVALNSDQTHGSNRNWLQEQLEKRSNLRKHLEDDLTYIREDLLTQRRYHDAQICLQNLLSTDAVLIETDRALVSELIETFRSAVSFKDAPQFTERDYLRQRIQNQIQQLRSRIKETPTYFGKVAINRTLYRLSREIETQFDILRQQNKPQLEFEIAKSTLQEHQLICHLKIDNVGQATAEEVSVTIKPDEGDDFFTPSNIMVGTVLPAPHNRNMPVTLLLKEDVNIPKSADILISSSYCDRERNPYQSEIVRLRISTEPGGRFEPINNPYITGKVVEDDNMFKGRNLLMQQIIEQVCAPHSTSAVVIFGQKRAGKSSILHHLAKRVPEWVIPVYLPLHEMFADAEVQQNLFYLIASEIQSEAYRRRRIEVPLIDEEAIFSSRVPSYVFKKYLLNVNEQIGSQHRVLLLFDEFTDLVHKIQEGKIEKGIMRFLKSLVEHGMFSCVISGIDSMPRVLKQYSNELAITNPRRVTYLDDNLKPEAISLIEDPLRLPEGNSRFKSPQVVEDIFRLTAGSPYYIQLFCHRLVEYLNSEQNPDPTITGADVDFVIKDIIQGKNPLSPWQCFDNLCRYKEDAEYDNFNSILEGLVLFLIADETQRNVYVPLNTITNRLPFVTEADIEHIVNDLVEREVLAINPDVTVRQYQIRVELFKRWINANRPMDDNALIAFRQKLSEYSR